MKVILTQDVKAQGKKGQMIEVSDGYGRNFLIARWLAIPADNKAINELKNREASAQHKIDVEKAEARDIAAKLEGILVKFTMSAGGDGPFLFKICLATIGVAFFGCVQSAIAL